MKLNPLRFEKMKVTNGMTTPKKLYGMQTLNEPVTMTPLMQLFCQMDQFHYVWSHYEQAYCKKGGQHTNTLMSSTESFMPKHQGTNSSNKNLHSSKRVSHKSNTYTPSCLHGYWSKIIMKMMVADRFFMGILALSWKITSTITVCYNYSEIWDGD